VLVTGFFDKVKLENSKGVIKLINNKDLNTQTLNMKDKIGIMGGTFDPIHFGHLYIAQTSLDKFELNKILFIPTGKPPHKNPKLITDSYSRMEMLTLATKSNPKFEVSSMEITREKTSYTIDTIRELQDYYNKETDMPGLLEINIVKHRNCTRPVSVGPSDFLGNCRGGSESGGGFRITGCHRL